MNLIERLGGYEKAKSIVDKAPCKTYTFHNHPYQKGYIRCWGGDEKEYFIVSDIEKALFEYRRQHNIFEVGDYVLPNSDHSNEVHFLSDWYIKDLDFRYKTKSGGWGVIVKSCMSTAWRHATDEEIKAGHRL